MIQNKMIYEEIPQYTGSEIAELLSGADEDGIVKAILSISLYCSDGNKATELCLDHLSSPHENVVRCSMIGLGHIARIHRNINFDIEKIEGEIRRLGLDKTMEGTVEDLRDDNRMYIINHYGLQ
jgi:hypothetical protein